MSKYKFKVGDRVRIRSWDDMAKEFGFKFGEINTPHCYFAKGMRFLCGETATIERIGNDSVVELAEWDTLEDTTWTFSLGMLEPVFVIGRCYQLHNYNRTMEGNVIKVTDCNRTTFNYEVIRGNDRCTHDGTDSSFANCLVPLYGKQIGEAIRAWDAKHGKACEVKRHAKAGEYIKILKPHMDGGCYKCGDILKVYKGTPGHGVYAFTKKMHPCCSTDVDKPMSWIADNEYVVLKGYKPPKIKAIYDKHAYTDEEIAKAKELCGKMMIEALENSTVGGIDFLKGKKPEEMSCLITGSVTKVGGATCSANDKFNVWIGRCVALCKALEKPIPNFILEGGK